MIEPFQGCGDRIVMASSAECLAKLPGVPNLGGQGLRLRSGNLAWNEPDGVRGDRPGGTRHVDARDSRMPGRSSSGRRITRRPIRSWSSYGSTYASVRM